jgi:hypothetical protein
MEFTRWAFLSMLSAVVFCSTLTDAGILPHLASHLVYEDDKLDILAEISWVLTYLTAWCVSLVFFQ